VAVELLVLKHMPRPRWFTSLSRGETLAKFFESAAKHEVHHLESPIGLFGVRDLTPPPDYGNLNEALRQAATLSSKAVDAEWQWSERRATRGTVEHPSHYWHELLGPDYPEDWLAEFIEAFRRWWAGTGKPGEWTATDPTGLYAYAPPPTSRSESPSSPKPARTTRSWISTACTEPQPAPNPRARHEAPVPHAAAKTARRAADPSVDDPPGSVARQTILDRIQPQSPRRPVVFGRTAW